mmetsp:Transcript_39481/g.84533  ORF Transcript_39481/g.84533 Transcript_39481/m.84533 type:complete len:146 (+) Transcript_39481:681-1118(+)
MLLLLPTSYVSAFVLPKGLPSRRGAKSDDPNRSNTPHDGAYACEPPKEPPQTPRNPSPFVAIIIIVVVVGHTNDAVCLSICRPTLKHAMFDRGRGLRASERFPRNPPSGLLTSRGKQRASAKEPHSLRAIKRRAVSMGWGGLKEG